MMHLKSTGTWTINTKHLVNSHLQRPKSVKAPDLFIKTCFQIKVNKLGRCHNFGPGRVPWGNFRCNCSCWGLIFMLFSYFVYILHFTKFTHGSSLFMKKSLLMEKSISRRKSLLKKKKIGPNWERRGTTLSSKEKFLCENDLYRWSFTLVSRFRTKKSLLNQNVPYMMLKMRFPFLYASTSLDT